MSTYRKSNFTKIYYDVNRSISCQDTFEEWIPVYKRMIPKFIGSPAINADIRYINRQKFNPMVGMSNPNKNVISISKDKNYVEDYYYFSKG